MATASSTEDAIPAATATGVLAALLRRRKYTTVAIAVSVCNTRIPTTPGVFTQISSCVYGSAPTIANTPITAVARTVCTMLARWGEP